MLSRTKKWMVLLVILLLAFGILDFGYLWANLKFMLRGQTKVYQNQINLQPVSLSSDSLSIPSLGITAPIVYVNQISENLFQAALKTGVVHYPGTANPGQNGNCYIFGHSSDFTWSKGHYKTVFAVLPHIKLGSNIYISDQAGKTFTYVVSKTFVVSANDTSVLKQDQSQKILTLQTSWPLGTALERFIVQSELKN